MNETLRDISATIAWYRKLPRDFNDINLLMNARRSLSTMLYEVAGILAEYARDKIAAEHVRKAFEAEKFAELRDKAEKPITSQIEAAVKALSVSYCQREADTEAEYQAAKIVYDAAKNVCDVMTQHIANLKSEKRDEMIGVGSQY